MKLLIQSVMIFFGTLMAAGLVALGEPAGPERGNANDLPAVQAVSQLIESAARWVELIPAALGLDR